MNLRHETPFQSALEMLVCMYGEFAMFSVLE